MGGNAGEKDAADQLREIRWGILGTGMIAERFLEALAVVPGARAVAVGSRTVESAHAFADRWAIPRRHAGRSVLAADTGVDVVYIATPHTDHEAAAVELLQAGKGVLCEKPLAVDSGQTERIVAAARDSGCFLMEAMWTRFLPAVQDALGRIAIGEIGALRSAQADIGWAVPFDAADRRYAPELGGGALLDLGVYPLALACRLLTEPVVGTARARLAPSGVDAEIHAVIEDAAGGARLEFTAALDRTLDPHVRIEGDDGAIAIPEWFRASGYTLTSGRSAARSLDFPHRANGMEYEAEAVSDLVRAGAAESPLMPWSDSLRLAALAGDVRRAAGIDP
ncbi:Gfo/Idh/MocA family protein [Nocardiopsis coralliicola]